VTSTPPPHLGGVHPGGAEPVRVLVVDDQELFRRGLTMLLGVEDGIEAPGSR
jgi:hypothetical protein